MDKGTALAPEVCCIKILYLEEIYMQDFLYDNYTRLLFGKEAEAQLGAQAAEFSKAKKALIV